MAKPGSNGARRIAATGSVDLSRAAMSEEQAARAQEMAEVALGARCKGCGRRIGLGFHFTSIDPRDERPVIELAACTREDCDFAEQAKDGATFCKAVEFAWFDPAGLDARPAVIIARQNEKRAAAETPQEPPEST